MNESNGKKVHLLDRGIIQVLLAVVGIGSMLLAILIPIINVTIMVQDNLRGDMAVLRDQMREDKIELRDQMREDKIELRDQVKRVEDQVKRVEDHVKKVEIDLRVVQNDVHEIKLTLNQLVDDVDGLKQANQSHEGRITRIESFGPALEQE